MTFPEHLLNDGEHVVVTTRTHPKALIRPVLIGIVVVVVAIVLSSLASEATPLQVVIWVFAAALLFWFVVRPVVDWVTTTYTFTNRRFVKRTGFIAREGRTIPLNRISGVDFEVGVIDRVFGCGTLVVSDASEQGRVLLFDIPQGRARPEAGGRRAAPPLDGRTRGRWVLRARPERPFTREGLERAILGEDFVLDATEVAFETGLTVEQTRRLWRALGFPERVNEQAFTRADAAAVTRVAEVVESGAIDFDMAVNLTRAVGQTMARLADWEVATLIGRVEEMEAGEQATGSRLGSALRLVETVNGPFESLLIYAWRRHLAAAAARVEALGANEEDLHTTLVTVGFADIVAFTELSNRLEEERLGDLIEVFESRCHDVVSAHGGRVIKSIGDSVLFVHEDVEEALETADGIITVIGRDPRMPDVRVGLASGSVIMRLGDVFGPPVNMAARLTAVARRNRVIVDDTTAALLPPERYETRRLTARPVRGFGLVEPVSVRRL